MPFDFDTTASGRVRSLGVGSLSTKPVKELGSSGRKRIFRNLYRALNRDPRKVLVMRPAAPGNMRWTITDSSQQTPRALLIQRPGLPDISVLLENSTIAQVRDIMAASGVALEYFTDDPVVLNLSALALIPGSGEKWQDNGDHIYAHRSILWAWAGPIGRWLDYAREDIAEMLRMLVVRQSGGQWSELWASYFGLQRKPVEPDAKLNLRTEWEWRRPRNNAKAMELNIRHLLDQTVTVREPWKEMMIVSGSVISGGDHLPNEAEFAYHRAQLQSRDVYDFGPSMEEAQADRPAGTLLIDPVVYPWPWEINASRRSIEFAAAPTFTAWILDFDGHIISVNWDLSNSFYLLNPVLAMSEELQFDETIIEGRGGDIGNRLTFCKGEIIVSEQWDIGYEDAPGPFDMPVSQQRLGGRRLQEFGEGLVLSDGGPLSDYEHELRLVPIDEWLLDRRSYDPPTPLVHPTNQPAPNVELSVGSEIEGVSLTSDAGTQTDISMGAQFAYDTGWNGRWTQRPWSFGFRKPVADFRSLQALPDGVPMVVTGTHSASLTTRKQFASAQVVNNTAQASLTTAIKLAGTAVNEPGYLVTFGAAIRMISEASATPVLTGALSTQIKLSASMVKTTSGSIGGNSSAPANSSGSANAEDVIVTAPLTAPLTTTIALQGQAVARANVVKANFAIAEISGTVQNVAYSFGTLRTAYPLVASINAQATASVVLTVGPRFSSLNAGAASVAAASLYTEPRFAATAQASSSAGASLQVGNFFSGVALAEASVKAASIVGAPAQLQAARSAVSAATAALRVGVRFVSSATVNRAVATATASLTANGAQTWPTTSRTWLFDPDDSTKRVVTDGLMANLYEVGGGTQNWFQNSANNRMPFVTIGNRGFMHVTGAFVALDGSSSILANFNDISTPCTYHMIYRTPSSTWSDVVPLMGSYSSGADAPASMLALESPAWNRVMQDAKRTSNSGYNYDRSAGSAGGMLLNTTYLLSWRRNSDGTTDFFVNGTKLTSSGGVVPSGNTNIGATDAQVGGYWPVANYTTAGAGYIGAFMRYGVAQSDATIASMATVKNSRYTNQGTSGSTINPTVQQPTTQTYTAMSNLEPEFIAGDGTGIVCGTKFRVSRSGTITGIRIWRDSASQQMSTVKLWTNNGTLLGTATVPAFTTPGWKTINFSSGIAISAGLYKASYWTQGHGYAIRDDELLSSITNGPLTIVSDGSADGPNGIIAYGTDFHEEPYFGAGGRNYYVDVVFVA